MKKIWRNLISVLLIAFALVFALPAGMPGRAVTAEAATVRLNAKKIYLIKGRTKKLRVRGISSKKAAKVKWRSSNRSVASVNRQGKVTARKKGTAVITAKLSGKKYTCRVTVETPRINRKSRTIAVGDSFRLKMKGTKQTVRWKSSRSRVATVSSRGLVKGKREGTANITASVGGRTYTCRVTVKKAESGLSVSATNVEVDSSAAVTVTQTIDKSGVIVRYLVDDSNIVECSWGDWDGNRINLNLTAKKKGSTKITITNNKTSESCVVQVKVTGTDEMLLDDYVMAAWGIECAQKNADSPDKLKVVKTVSFGKTEDAGGHPYKLVAMRFRDVDQEGRNYYFCVSVMMQSEGYYKQSDYTDVLKWQYVRKIQGCYLGCSVYADGTLALDQGTVLSNKTAVQAYHKYYSSDQSVSWE